MCATSQCPAVRCYTLTLVSCCKMLYPNPHPSSSHCIRWMTSLVASFLLVYRVYLFIHLVLLRPDGLATTTTAAASSSLLPSPLQHHLVALRCISSQKSHDNMAAGANWLTRKQGSDDGGIACVCVCVCVCVCTCVCASVWVCDDAGKRLVAMPVGLASCSSLLRVKSNRH